MMNGRDGATSSAITVQLSEVRPAAAAQLFFFPQLKRLTNYKANNFNHNSLGLEEEKENNSVQEEKQAANNLLHMRYTPVKDIKSFIKLGESLGRLPPIKELHGLIGQCTTRSFRKILTESDVRDNQARLIIHAKFAKEAIKPLLRPNEKLSEGITAIMYDHRGKVYNMKYKQWTDKPHVIFGDWLKFCKEHKLIALVHRIRLWAFRHSETDKLCFAITWELRALKIIEYRPEKKIENNNKRKRKN
ncbi:hypothetical protein AQUCO_04900035v1 [Aquilegia coerulea]|uniref:TF-B3 domain-containing protein n=1 Tax=Aquilegia coerulea TaxID=218851 RepID=A0A2G5CKU9_AQUCA|nr:hypothetical protein AQUCO_04900035v1 [Aquilegia coerulea]